MSERPQRRRRTPKRYREDGRAVADVSDASSANATPRAPSPTPGGSSRRRRRLDAPRSSRSAAFAALPAAEQRRRINEGLVRFRNRRFVGSNYRRIELSGCTLRGNNNNLHGDENYVYGDGNFARGDNNVFQGRNNRAEGVNNVFLDADGEPIDDGGGGDAAAEPAQEAPDAQDAVFDSPPITGEPDIDAFLRSESRALASFATHSVAGHPLMGDILQQLVTSLRRPTDAQAPASAPHSGFSPLPERGAPPEASKWKLSVLDLPGQSSKTTVSELQCIVCFDNKRDTIYEPCGHTSVCRECTRTLYDPDKTLPSPVCPQCRSLIVASRIIY
jgi:hypothetical protein